MSDVGRKMPKTEREARMRGLAFQIIDEEAIPPEPPDPPQELIELIDQAKAGLIPSDGIFPFAEYLQTLDQEKLLTREGRVELTKDDPLAFALVYLAHHLQGKSTGNDITFAQLHMHLLKDAKGWATGTGELREHRDCYVAPRDSGKTTWLFLILPLWVAAHEYFKFVVAYSDAIEQARIHLATLRSELESNELLRWDFPDLCKPKTIGTTNRLASQRQDLLKQYNDFIFVAKGMNSASLGLKIGRLRPELIILDDIEPGEEKYSLDSVAKRLEALRSKIFYQNQSARVVLVGTVTRPGSIVHQLVESLLHPSDETPEWIKDENFKVHYFAPILTDEWGNESSCWPAKWPIEYLKAHEHEREFKKNFANQPVNLDGDYWSPEDIRYLTDDDRMAPVQTILELDVATTSGAQSHYTGIAVVACDPFNGEGKCLLLHVRRVKLPPRNLRKLVLELLDAYPEIGKIRVESNQGGEAWFEVFHDMPVRVKLHPESVNKTIRTITLLNHYQRGRVLHERHFRQFEEILLAYPNVMEDDQIDAVAAGVEYFLKPRIRQQKSSMDVKHYV
jgi:phage terminase large subunit-like protein